MRVGENRQQIAYALDATEPVGKRHAGLIMIALGAVLFLLPLANWQVNLRGRRVAAAG